MSGKRKSQKIEETAKKPKLDDEISAKLTDTKKIPDVVWQRIFGFFSLKEIKLTVAKVCRHFYEISNDCVQEIKLNMNTIASDKKYEMYDALPTFKYLKTIKINSFDVHELNIEYFVMHALRNCPRLRELHFKVFDLSVGFINQIVKHGQKLNGLELDFGKTRALGILSALKTGMKKLNRIKLFYMKSIHYATEELISLVASCEELNSLSLHKC